MSRLHRSLSAALVLVVCSTPAQAQLLHRYTFNGATEYAEDAIGNANGTLYTGATITGTYLHLENSGFVDFSTFLVPTGGTFTVSVFARANPGANPGIHELLSQGSSNGIGPAYGFYIGTGNSAYMRLTDAWPNSPLAFIADGQFHNYTLTSNGSVAKAYLDGTSVGTLNQQIGLGVTGSNTSFGRQFGGNGEYFQGDLDDISIYGTALYDGQVASLAAARISATPEPASFVLFATGLTGLAIAHRRRRGTR